MAAQHKPEALRALGQVRDQLAGAEAIDGHARFLLRASVEYVIAEVEAIEERQRAPRRARGQKEARA